MYFQSHPYPCHKKPNYTSTKTFIEMKTEAKVGVAVAKSINKSGSDGKPILGNTRRHPILYIIIITFHCLQLTS